MSGFSLWLPEGVAPHNPARKMGKVEDDRPVIGVCRVPTGVDAMGNETVCGMPFREGEERALAMHLKLCTERHADEIREAIERHHPEILKPLDKEFAAWLRSNRKGIMEGRLKAY